MLVGAGARTGRHLDQDPLAWTSPDGLTWTPQEMPAEPVTEGVHRVVELGDGRLLAVSLARTSVGVLATLSTGDHYELWQTADGRDWRQVVVPLTPETAGDHTLAVADGDGPLLVADAGEGGRVWSGALIE